LFCITTLTADATGWSRWQQFRRWEPGRWRWRRWWQWWSEWWCSCWRGGQFDLSLNSQSHLVIFNSAHSCQRHTALHLFTSASYWSQEILGLMA